MSLNWLIWNWTSPSTLLGILATLALVLLPWRRSRRLGRWLGAVVLGVLALVLLVPVGPLLINRLEAAYPPPLPAALADAEMIVVLAGSERVRISSSREQPGLGAFGARLFDAAALERSLPHARLVHIGGPGAQDWSETQIARMIFQSLGVDDSRVTYLHGAASTRGNALALAAHLRRQPPAGKILLVTSAFHLPRAMLSFRAVGIDAIPVPAGYMTPRQIPFYWRNVSDIAQDLRMLDLAAHEYLGLALYRLRGWL
ncbi:MAG: YdcF family protein [Pseudomonadota bacterium]